MPPWSWDSPMPDTPAPTARRQGEARRANGGLTSCSTGNSKPVSSWLLHALRSLVPREATYAGDAGERFLGPYAAAIRPMRSRLAPVNAPRT